MSREITFVHLTDLHIGDPETDDHLFSETRKTLEEILPAGRKYRAAPEFPDRQRRPVEPRRH